MPRYELPSKWVEYLKTRPESGMGYQNVEVWVPANEQDGCTWLSGIVLNCEILQVDVPIDVLSILNIFVEGEV